MQRFDREIESLIFLENKATDQNKGDGNFSENPPAPQKTPVLLEF